MEDYKPKNWWESLNCAIEGIIYAVKTQRHMRYHFLFAILSIIIGLILNLPGLVFVVFILSFLLLLFAEIINTAIEVSTDLVTKEYNPLAKVVKDMAAGGVLVSSFGVFVTGYLIFADYLYRPFAVVLGRLRDITGYLAFFSLLTVLISVVMAKAHFGRGTPLHGGMPSGHAAVAFSIWISVALLTLDPIITILTLFLAILVSQSRLVGGIHTKFEVFMGALLGIGVTLLIFSIAYLFPFVKD